MYQELSPAVERGGGGRSNLGEPGRGGGRSPE